MKLKLKTFFVPNPGLGEKYLIPSRLHFCLGLQLFWPLFRTNDENVAMEDRTNLFYANPEWYEHMENASEIYIDATFRAVCATEYRQILVISVKADFEHNTKYLPIFMIIMSSKSESNYRRVFRELANNKNFMGGRRLKNLKFVCTVGFEHMCTINCELSTTNKVGNYRVTRIFLSKK